LDLKGDIVNIRGEHIGSRCWGWNCAWHLSNDGISPSISEKEQFSLQTVSVIYFKLLKIKQSMFKTQRILKLADSFQEIGPQSAKNWSRSCFFSYKHLLLDTQHPKYFWQKRSDACRFRRWDSILPANV